MDTTLLGTIAAAVAAIVAALLSYRAARRSTAHEEIEALRTRVIAAEDRNVKLWAYCRKLIDHIYRGHGPPPPPPDDLDALLD